MARYRTTVPFFDSWGYHDASPDFPLVFERPDDVEAWPSWELIPEGAVAPPAPVDPRTLEEQPAMSELQLALGKNKRRP